jgi:hypothetical protein
MPLKFDAAKLSFVPKIPKAQKYGTSFLCLAELLSFTGKQEMADGNSATAQRLDSSSRSGRGVISSSLPWKKMTGRDR